MQKNKTHDKKKISLTSIFEKNILKTVDSVENLIQGNSNV